MKKILVGFLGLVVVVVGGAAIFLAVKSPAQRPASTEKIEATRERVKRGAYLVESALSCVHCHSELKADRFGMPLVPGTKGGGGTCWDESMDFPGRLCSANITPDPETGIGAWTDGEILRAIREGVNRQGQALFNLMPYQSYRHLSDEDARSIVVYLRTLAPIRRARAPRELKPPLNIVVKFQPRPLEGPVLAPDPKDRLAWGKYLVTSAGCPVCHTPVDDKHQPLPGKEFSGGQVFKFAWGGVVRSANLTPHATGLGPRTKENFISLFAAFRDPELHEVPIDPKTNTVMPWLGLSGLSDEDLGAIYDYLRTVPPIDNAVEKRPPPGRAQVAGVPPKQ